MNTKAIVVSVMFGVSLATSVMAAPYVESRPGFTTGIIRDQATGYLWQKAQQAGKTYAQADSYCKALVLDGYTNFRVPTQDELATIGAYTTGTLLGTSGYSSWSATPGKTAGKMMTMGLYNNATFFNEVINTSSAVGVRCVIDRPKTVVVPTDGYYKFKVTSGNGVVAAAVNGVKAITVDTQFNQGEVVIGQLLAGEEISITTNDLGAASIVEEQLPEFPFVQWNYSFVEGNVELILYDPLPESPAATCTVTQADVDDVQSLLDTCNATVTYSANQLSSVQGQLAVCNSDKAVVESKLATSEAALAAANTSLNTANARIAELEAALAIASQYTYGYDGYDHAGYDRDGFDRQGHDKQGYDHEGFNAQGWNREGRDHGGFDCYGYDKEGHDRNGNDKDGKKHVHVE